MADPKYDAFLVYADADRAWAEGYLKPALNVPEKRLATVSKFRPGAARIEEFERAVQASRLTILVLSPAFFAEPWTAFGETLASFAAVEAGAARIVPCLPRPCDVPLRIRYRVMLDFTDPDRQDAEARRLRELLERPDPTDDPAECPYPGMVPFEEKDAAFFEGRGDEASRMVRHFRNQDFLVVIGASGSGKSSLVRAGFLPTLSRSRLFQPGEWRVIAARPSAGGLDRALGMTAATPRPDVAALLAADPPARRLMVVVDQLEEAFSQLDAEARARFFEVIGALRADPAASLLLAMRSDFFADLMDSPLWPVLPVQRSELTRLKGDALRKAIAAPAEKRKVFLDPELVQRLLRDASDEPGALPLVQETLVLLWERMKGRYVPLNAYERMGGPDRTGLSVAVSEKADAALAALSPDRRDVARRILLRLVQFGEGRPDTRRRVREADLGGPRDEVHAVLEHLVSNRLLVVDDDPASPDRSWVDLAHEIILSGWPELRAWVEQGRAAEQGRRRLEEKAAEYALDHRGPLDEVELASALKTVEVVDALGLDVSDAVRRLVDDGRREIDRRRREREEHLAALQRERDEAVRQAGIAESRRLATLAKAEIDYHRVDTALLLALEALRVAETGEAWDALRHSQEHSPHLITYLLGGGRPVNAVAFSPCGRYLASADDRGLIRLWDVASRRPLDVVLDQGRCVNCLAFHPDGGVLAAGDDGGRVRLWAVDVWKRFEDLADPAETFPITALAFSPDGALLATGSYGSSVVVWDWATRRAVDRYVSGLTDPEGMDWNAYLHSGLYAQVKGLAFCREGRALASTSEAVRGILLRDVAGRTSLTPHFADHEGGPVALASGRREGMEWIVSAGADGRVICWDPGKGLPVAVCRKDTTAVVAVAVNPASTPPALAAAQERDVILWEPGPTIETLLGVGDRAHSVLMGRDLATLRGHHNRVTSVAVHPGGGLVASSGFDGRVVLWDASPAGPSRLEPSDGAIVAVALLDGNLAACGDEKGRLALVDLAAWRGGVPPGCVQEKPMARMAASPDGRGLATVDKGACRIWARTPEGLEVESSAEGEFEQLCYDGAGALLAGRRDGRVTRPDASRKAVEFPPPAGLFRLVALARIADGAVFAVGERHVPRAVQVVVWRPGSDDEPILLDGHRDNLFTAAVSPDGTRLATSGSDGTVYLWRLDRAGLLGPLIDWHPANALAFSPTHPFVACSLGRNGVYLIDLVTRRPLGPTLGAGDVAITALAFSPDGKTLLTGSEDGTLLRWDVDPQSWRARATRTANRNLTRAEWGTFFGADVPYRRTIAELPEPESPRAGGIGLPGGAAGDRA